MQKKMMLFAMCFMCVGLIACGTKSESSDVKKSETSSVAETEPTSQITEADEPIQTTSAVSEETETAAPEQTEAAAPEQTEAGEPEQTEAAQPEKNEDTTVEQSGSETAALTQNQALDAIKNYCFINNPNLKDMVNSAEYTIYWDVTTNDANEIVVLYRAYTGAQTYYYIDPVSGSAYVTELVPGIIDEEQRTGETLNVRDYLV